MELLVNLDHSGTEAYNEAQDVIVRLQRQNITQYELIPNSTNPTAIKFSYDGRQSNNQSVESSRDQYNDVRDGGTFVSMSQVLQTILAKHGRPTKKDDHMFARVPIHLRTRAQPGQPAQDVDGGKTIFRTINDKYNPMGSWIVLLQNSQYQKHLNNTPSAPNTPDTLPTAEELKQKLGLNESVSVIDNDNLNETNSSNIQNDLFNSNNDPRDSKGFIPPQGLNNLFKKRQSRLNQRRNQR